MSRHIFRTQRADGVPVTVTAGYDRSLNYFHVAIESADEDEDISNLAFTDAFDFTLDDVQQVINERGITPPASFFEEIRLDAENRAGNRVVEHFSDRPFVEVA